MPDPPDHLVWKEAIVEGRPALYGVAGEGIPLLFIHGWGLGQHSYKRALKRLVHLGCRVYAPALPGFGGTPDLPRDAFSFEGYAAWIAAFLEAVEVAEPMFVVGHSFGGGVAIRVAHDFPDTVRVLVLVNSVGGSTWQSSERAIRSMAERPLWDWGLHFPRDLLDPGQATRVLPVILEDAVPNLVRNPRALLKVAGLARRADLTPELEELKRRKLPVVVLWGDQDTIIPRASFDALCAAIGSEGEVIEGNHSWLLSDPDAFGEVMTNVLEVHKLARDIETDEDEVGRRRRLRRLRRVVSPKKAAAAGGRRSGGRPAAG